MQRRADRRGPYRGRRIAAAILVLAAFVTPAFAQDIPEPPAADLDAADSIATVDLSAEDRALLAGALGAGNYNFSGASRALRPPRAIATRKITLDVARTDAADGSATVVVKKPLAPAWTEWDAKVGADLNLASASKPYHDGPYDPARIANNGPGSGAAWASVGVPQLAVVDARIDPVNDTGRLGTTLTRAMPLSDRFTVTLESSYSVTETFSPQQPSASSAAIPQVWGKNNVAKFDILHTGTTFAAGLSSTSVDPVTHNTFSAEQKVYGPLRVSTAVTDLGQPTASRSVNARLKLNW